MSSTRLRLVLPASEAGRPSIPVELGRLSPADGAAGQPASGGSVSCRRDGPASSSLECARRAGSRSPGRSDRSPGRVCRAQRRASPFEPRQSHAQGDNAVVELLLRCRHRHYKGSRVRGPNASWISRLIERPLVTGNIIEHAAPLNSPSD